MGKCFINFETGCISASASFLKLCKYYASTIYKRKIHAVSHGVCIILLIFPARVATMVDLLMKKQTNDTNDREGIQQKHHFFIQKSSPGKKRGNVGEWTMKG